jgi:phage gp36-like protein
MTNYCEREDVIRWYGGTQANVMMYFDRQLLEEDLTEFEIDGLTFDLPTTILLRIDASIVTASSELDTRILQAYLALPTTIPPHLRHATAKLAARDALTDDGVLTDRIRRGVEEVMVYFDHIANKRLDLGIVEPRPSPRGPIVKVVSIGNAFGGNAFGLNSGKCGC